MKNNKKEPVRHLQMDADLDRKRKLDSRLDDLAKANPADEARYREEQRKLRDDIDRLDKEMNRVREDNDRNRALLDDTKKKYDDTNKKRIFRKVKKGG